jgi:predicted lipid-binding transport protein (Tim44 family)
MVMTRIALIGLSAALIATTWMSLKYYKDTERTVPPMMRKFLYGTLIIATMLLVTAGFQFLFALGIALLVAPAIMWYMRLGSNPYEKAKTAYFSLPSYAQVPVV